MNVDSIYGLIDFEDDRSSYNTALALIKTDPIAILTLNIYGHHAPKCFKVESSIKRSDIWVKKITISLSKSISVFVYIYRNYSQDTGIYKKVWFKYKNTCYRLNVKSDIKIINLYALLHRILA